MMKTGDRKTTVYMTERDEGRLLRANRDKIKGMLLKKGNNEKF